MSRYLLRFGALGYLALILLVPVGFVFYRAFEHGVGPAWDAVTSHQALHALELTLLMAAIAVPANTVFGVILALALVRSRFPGRGLVNAIVDLPLALSPVVVGLALFLLYGRGGWLGGLADHGIKILFAVPGMVLATMFVSLPFVVREVVPVLREIGTEQEQAAETLGASPFQDVLEDHAAGDPLGRRLRGRTHHRAGDRRVRCGQRRLRQDPGPHGDAPALRAGAVRAVRRAGRVRCVGGACADRDRYSRRLCGPSTRGRRRAVGIAAIDVTKRFGSFTALDQVRSPSPRVR